jgi:hypothetical protein
MDVCYFIISTLCFIGLLVFAIHSLNSTQLANLSMPRDPNGQPCGLISDTSTGSLLQIYGPSINDRKCVESCGDTSPNYELGGICVSPQVKSILQQSGEYEQYIAPKLNSLSRLQMILVALGVTLLISIVFSLLIEFSSHLCNGGCTTWFIIVVSFLSAGVTLFFLYPLIPLPVWVGLCLAVVLYLLYVIVWKVFRSSNSLR